MSESESDLISVQANGEVKANVASGRKTIIRVNFNGRK